jgi:xylulokinase
MNWLRELFYDLQMKAGDKIDWGSFYRMAEDAPPGASGLMLIPYFSGTNAPYWDLQARGVIFGLWLDHGRSHLVRAVIEGLGYEIRRLLNLMKKGTGNSISKVRMYGGSAKSDIWNQIFSDVLGLVVQTLDTPETTALGAALCAAKALGIYPGFTEAVQNMVRVKKEYSPDRGRQSFYDELFHEVYEKFYDRVSGLVHDLSERTGRLSQ